VPTVLTVTVCAVTMVVMSGVVVIITVLVVPVIIVEIVIVVMLAGNVQVDRRIGVATVVTAVGVGSIAPIPVAVGITIVGKIACRVAR